MGVMIDERNRGVSPEEKLLRVIQGGGGASPSGPVGTKPPRLAVKVTALAKAPVGKTAATKVAPPPPPVAAVASDALDELPTVAYLSVEPETAVVPVKPVTAPPSPAKPAAALPSRPSTAAGSTPVPPAATVVPAAKPGKSGKSAGALKLAAPSPVPVVASGGAELPSDAVVAPAPGGNDPAAQPVQRKPFGVSYLNNILVVIVLVVLVWTVVDVSLTVRAAPRELVGAAGEEVFVPVAEPESGLPDLGAILTAWDQKKLFPGKSTQPPPPPPPGTEAVKELVIKGTSEGTDGVLEAIFVNKRTGKMRFLRVGEAFTLDEKQYTLTKLEESRVVFSDGVRDIYVP